MHPNAAHPVSLLRALTGVLSGHTVAEQIYILAFTINVPPLFGHVGFPQKDRPLRLPLPATTQNTPHLIAKWLNYYLIG